MGGTLIKPTRQCGRTASGINVKVQSGAVSMRVASARLREVLWRLERLTANGRAALKSERRLFIIRLSAATSATDVEWRLRHTQPIRCYRRCYRAAVHFIRVYAALFSASRLVSGNGCPVFHIAGRQKWDGHLALSYFAGIAFSNSVSRVGRVTLSIITCSSEGEVR